MTAWLQSGALIDAILGLILVEAILLSWLAAQSGWSKPVIRVVALLVPGACLMLAIRFAVVGADPVWILGALTAAGIAHLIDLALRFSR